MRFDRPLGARLRRICKWQVRRYRVICDLEEEDQTRWRKGGRDEEGGKCSVGLKLTPYLPFHPGKSPLFNLVISVLFSTVQIISGGHSVIITARGTPLCPPSTPAPPYVGAAPKYQHGDSPSASAVPAGALTTRYTEGGYAWGGGWCGVGRGSLQWRWLSGGRQESPNGGGVRGAGEPSPPSTPQ